MAVSNTSCAHHGSCAHACKNGDTCKRSLEQRIYDVGTISQISQRKVRGPNMTGGLATRSFRHPKRQNQPIIMREAPSTAHICNKEEQWQLDRIKSDKHNAQTKGATILRRNQYNAYRRKPADAVQLKVTHYGILCTCTRTGMHNGVPPTTHYEFKLQSYK